MMSFIVIAPHQHVVHLGLPKPYPQASIPPALLPLTPPLSFATAFVLACAKHLSLTKSHLATHHLVVATPSTAITPDANASLRHAATHLLHMPIRFYPAYRCFTAVAARPCTILHIAHTHTTIFDQFQLHVVKTALHQLHHHFISHLASLSPPQLHHLTATAAVVPPSPHSQLGHVTAQSYTLPPHVRNSVANVFFTHDRTYFHSLRTATLPCLVLYPLLSPIRSHPIPLSAETDLASRLARFLQSSHDVYQRDRNRYVFCVGAGALPGISRRLQMVICSCSASLFCIAFSHSPCSCPPPIRLVRTAGV